MVKVKKDLTGQRFGRLVVLEQAEDWVSPFGKDRKAMWLCRCDCGKEKNIDGSALKRGLVVSCGCYNSELIAERNRKNKKMNKYDLTGEYGIGFTNNGYEFYFDLEDYNKIKDYHWYSCQNDYGRYILAHKDNKQISMHRLLMNIHEDYNTSTYIYVDHINHITYDNRKKNLRIVTNTQNQMNKKTQRNNVSGIPGVYFKTRDKLWEATISINNKNIYLGSSKDKEKVIKLRKEAEDKYFGEYSYDNSMAISKE